MVGNPKLFFIGANRQTDWINSNRDPSDNSLAVRDDDIDGIAGGVDNKYVIAVDRDRFGMGAQKRRITDLLFCGCYFLIVI